MDVVEEWNGYGIILMELTGMLQYRGTRLLHDYLNCI